MKIRYCNRDGFIDYNDLATQSTPIAYTTGTIKITNDGAWPYGDSANKSPMVTRLWNTATGQFDFSQLSIGDQVFIRCDIVVTTSTPNQEVELDYVMDIWWANYTVHCINQYFKTAKAYHLWQTTDIYIGNVGTKNNPAELRFQSDWACSIKVNWFYISTKRK